MNKDSIYNLIEDLENEWNYRKEDTNRYKPIKKKLLEEFNKLKANEFINDYLKSSGKSDIYRYFNKLGIINFDSTSKAEHTISIFFLGLIINKNCFNSEIYKDEETPANYLLFPFIWFLTCIFHDYACNMESESEKHLKDINSIDDFNSKYDIKNKLLECKDELVSKELERIIESNQLEQYIESYFKYRIDKNKKLDHGIIGGLLIFDFLVQNRENKNSNDRFWKEELDVLYAKASMIIATHNIWFKDKNVQKAEGMDGIDKVKKISYCTNKLQFLLGLVDSIDPLKIYNCIDNPKKIFKNVLLSFPKANTIEISIAEDSDLNPRCLSKIENKIDWLGVDVEGINRGIIITIPTK